MFSIFLLLFWCFVVALVNLGSFVFGRSLGLVVFCLGFLFVYAGVGFALWFCVFDVGLH